MYNLGPTTRWCSINQSIFVLLTAKATADTAETEVIKTRLRSLFSRTKIGMVNYGRIMQFLQKLSFINVLVSIKIYIAPLQDT